MYDLNQFEFVCITFMLLFCFVSRAIVKQHNKVIKHELNLEYIYFVLCFHFECKLEKWDRHK